MIGANQNGTAVSHRFKKTQAVLNSISQGNETLAAIGTDTGLSTRCISGLIYALERQGRVIADDYQKQRSEQHFTILCLHRAPNGPRIHPYKRLKSDRAAQFLHTLDSVMLDMIRASPQQPQIRQETGDRCGD